MSGKSPDPTPEEIKAECEKIQRGWNETQLRSRTVKGPDRWQLPVYNIRGISPGMGALIDELDEEVDMVKED